MTFRWYGLKVTLVTALLLSIGVRNTKAQESVPLPQTRAAMTDQLIVRTKDSHRANVALAKAKPEEAFEIVRDHWKTLDNDEVKQKLLYAITESENPHLLEILNLGANDDSSSVRLLTYDLLQNFALHNFVVDPAAYPAWYATTVGKPVAEVVARESAAFVAQFRQVDVNTRSSLLSVLRTMEFSKTDGLASVRRKAMLDAGLLTVFETALSSPRTSQSEQTEGLRFLEIVPRLQPEEPFFQRAIVPLATGKSAPRLRSAAISLLGFVKSDWVAETLFKIIQDDPAPSVRDAAVSTLVNIQDLHQIPRLIALLEADDSPTTTMMLNFRLRQLTGARVQVSGLQAGFWWHTWWDRNKTAFPLDVQAIPYPKIRSHRTPRTNGPFVQRQAEKHSIGDDAQREYWLLSPGYIAPPTQDASSSLPHFGLLVVLADGKGNGEDLADFWQEVVRKSLKDGYFVALPIAPRWSAHQPVAWVTQQSLAQVPEARFSTESFLNAIVADVSAHCPIDPARVMLHGVGEGGLAAYACSLGSITPFKGFYILSSPFKTAQLPPLTGAKGKHYLIQSSREDKTAPYFQAVAADDLLRKQSAIVKLITIPGEQHGYSSPSSAYTQIAQAIDWLNATH